MNIVKHMEVIFLVAAFLGGVTSYASAALPDARFLRDAQISVQGESKIAVVKVSAKRLASSGRSAK